MMVKIVAIGTEARIAEYNGLCQFSGHPKISFMRYADPTMADYMLSSYIEFEIRVWESKGYEFVQLVDSCKMIVRKSD